MRGDGLGQKKTLSQGTVDKRGARQRNVIWPGFVGNGGLVDKFLIKGNPDAPIVQRVGACLFGLAVIVPGLVILSFAITDRSLFEVFMSLALIAFGGLMFLNGCRHGRRKPERESGRRSA